MDAAVNSVVPAPDVTHGRGGYSEGSPRPSQVDTNRIYQNASQWTHATLVIEKEINMHAGMVFTWGNSPSSAEPGTRNYRITYGARRDLAFPFHVVTLSSGTLMP